MAFGSFIIVLFIFLLAGLIIIRPFLDPDLKRDLVGSRRYDSLLAERERLYAVIEELDLNLELNKISDAEYRIGRQELLVEAAAVLKKIDQHPFRPKQAAKQTAPKLNDEELDRLIAERRQAIRSPEDASCPGCGEAVSPGNQFCSHCGEKLS